MHPLTCRHSPRSRLDHRYGREAPGVHVDDDFDTGKESKLRFANFWNILSSPNSSNSTFNGEYIFYLSY